MAVITMKQLLEAGVHFGHRTRRWNPKMRPYIFTERSGIHIIDLSQTMNRIEQYYVMIRDKIASGGTVLFVGTKRQAQVTIQEDAERARMPYINQRWLGGTLTNWATIQRRIEYLLQMERRWDAGEFTNFNKKEQLSIEREIAKLNRRLGGLKTMSRLPDMLFVVDTHLEELAVKEASKLGIPIVGVVDTNSNPDPIEYIIPSNDDAIRSVKLIVTTIANAAAEGMRMREVDLVDTGRVSQDDLVGMEQYLGPSTLAKLQGDEEDAEKKSDDIADAGSPDAPVAATVADKVADEITDDTATEFSRNGADTQAADEVAEASEITGADTQAADEVAEVPAITGAGDESVDKPAGDAVENPVEDAAKAVTE